MRLVPFNEKATEMKRTEREMIKALRGSDPREKVNRFQQAFRRYLTYKQVPDPMLVKIFKEEVSKPEFSAEEEVPELLEEEEEEEGEERPVLLAKRKKSETSEEERLTPAGWRPYPTRLAKREKTYAPRKKKWLSFEEDDS